MQMKYKQVNGVTSLWFLLALSLMNVIQADKTQDPFYIIAHMANNRASIDWAVRQGANAIESDFQFNGDGHPSLVEHGKICDCLCGFTKDHICRQGLQRKCVGPKASNEPAAHLQHVAHLDSIALLIIDSKVEAKWGSRLIKAGEVIIPFVDKHLFENGYKGKVVIAAAKVNTYDYIKAAVNAANNSPNKDRYFFTFDGEGDDYHGVIAMLSPLTNHRVYGTGITSCLGETFYTAIQNSVAGKNKGENGITYIWTIDKESSMRDYIHLGIQGIITNRVGVAKQVAISMGLTLAKPSTPISVSKSTKSAVDKCDCDYHKGGCKISWPAPQGKACKCQYKLFWTCEGSLVNCDSSHPKCSDPDGSKEACELGHGDCDGY